MKGQIIKKGNKVIGVSLPNPELRGTLTMTVKKGMNASEFQVEDELVKDPEKLSKHLSKIFAKSSIASKKKTKTKKRS